MIKLTEQEIASLIKEAAQNSVIVRDGSTSFRIANAIQDALIAKNGGAEPVYAFRRKGQDSFCTCDEERYSELSDKPNLFEMAIFYRTPQPAYDASKYLAGGTRYKVGFINGSYQIAGLPAELNGEWVALVSATDNNHMLQAAPQPAEVQGWQPIETAPKDGTRVLIRATVGSMLVPEPKTVVGRYSRGWWLEGGSMDLSYATHWMPLPTPPAMMQGEKK